MNITFDGDGYYEGYNDYNEYNDYSDYDDNTPLKTITPVKFNVKTSFHINALSVPLPRQVEKVCRQGGIVRGCEVGTGQSQVGGIGGQITS